MLTSIPFISEGGEKSPVSQPASSPDPGTGAVPGQHQQLMVFQQPPVSLTTSSQEVRAHQASRLSIPKLCLVAEYQKKKPQHTSTHTSAALNLSWSQISTRIFRGRKGKGKFSLLTHRSRLSLVSLRAFFPLSI